MDSLPLLRTFLHGCTRKLWWWSAALLLGLSCHTAHAALSASDMPSSLAFETPHGTLHIQSSEYIYESRLLLDDQLIQPAIRGLLNIAYAFQIDNSYAALVAISDGDYDCVVHYRWIVLDKNRYTVSAPFGSCSTHIQVSAKGRLLQLITPSQHEPDKMDVHTYDGKRIQTHSRAATQAEKKRRLPAG